MAQPQRPLPAHVQRALTLLSSGSLALNNSAVFESPTTLDQLQHDLRQALGGIPSGTVLLTPASTPGFSKATAALHAAQARRREPILHEGLTVSTPAIATAAIRSLRQRASKAALDQLETILGENGRGLPLRYAFPEQMCRDVHHGRSCTHGPVCQGAKTVQDLLVPASHRFLVTGLGCDVVVATYFNSCRDPSSNIAPTLHIPAGACFATSGLFRAVKELATVSACDEYVECGKCRYWGKCNYLHVERSVMPHYSRAVLCKHDATHWAACEMAHTTNELRKSPWALTPSPMRPRSVHYPEGATIELRNVLDGSMQSCPLSQIGDTLGGAMVLLDPDWVGTKCHRPGCGDFGCWFVHTVPVERISDTPALNQDVVPQAAVPAVPRPTLQAKAIAHPSAEVLAAGPPEEVPAAPLDPVGILPADIPEDDEGLSDGPSSQKAVSFILEPQTPGSPSLLHIDQLAKSKPFAAAARRQVMPAEVVNGLRAHLTNCSQRRRCHDVLMEATNETNALSALWQTCGTAPKRIFWSTSLGLGNGSYASVFVGVREETHLPVAVKFFNENAAETLTSQLMDYHGIFQEARVLALQSEVHSGLVNYISHFIEAGQNVHGDESKHFFLVTDLMQGTLDDIAKRWSKATYPLYQRLTAIRSIVQGLLSVCDDLHSVPDAEGYKMVHRDLNLNNVMLDVTSRVRVVDVGISRLLHSQSWNRTVTAAPVYDNGFRPFEVVDAIKRNCKYPMTTAEDIFAVGRIALALILPYNEQRTYIFDGKVPNVILAEGETQSDYLVPHSLAALSDFVDRLTVDLHDRPTAATALAHPFFWTPEECVAFLAALANEWQEEKPTNQDWKLASSRLKKALAAATNGKMDWKQRLVEADKEVYGKFEVELTKRAPQYLPTYVSNKPVHLLRLIRNHSPGHHLPLLPAELILKAFPSLTITCLNIARDLYGADDFMRRPMLRMFVVRDTWGARKTMAHVAVKGFRPTIVKEETGSEEDREGVVE